MDTNNHDNGSNVLDPPPLVLLGIPFHNLTFAEAVEWVLNRIETGQPGYIATANLDFLQRAWKDPELQRILIEASLVIADGMPIVKMSRYLGPKLKERVTGSDLTPMLAEAASENACSIFALGAAPGVADQAMHKLKERYPGFQIAGTYSPEKAEVIEMDNSPILTELKASRPDILLVAFGAPKQEKWINMHFRDWDIPVAMGIGGTLDFLAGTQSRAPSFFQCIGLEWCWRMLANPKRLVKRYAGNLFFFISAVGKLLQIKFLRSKALSNPVSAEDPALQNLERYSARFFTFPSHNDEKSRNTVLNTFKDSLGEKQHIIADMKSFKWLNSLELGTLLTIANECRRKKKTLFLINTVPRVEALLKLYRLTDYLKVAISADALIDELESIQNLQTRGEISLENGGMLTITLPYEFTAANKDEIKREFHNHWQQETYPNRLVVDASQTDFIDSAGVGFLAAAKKKCEQNGIPMRCTGFHGKALRTLRIFKVEKILL